MQHRKMHATYDTGSRDIERDGAVAFMVGDVELLYKDAVWR